MSCTAVPGRVAPTIAAPAAMTSITDGGTAVSAGSRASAGLFGLTSTDCLRLRVIASSGQCDGISLATDIHLIWNSGSSQWESGATDWTGTGSGGTGQVVFGVTSGLPYLTIDGVSMTPLGYDTGALFAGSGAVLCGGTPVACNNYFTVRVTCSCCTIEGWEGEGWYCVREAGTDGVCAPQELLDEDKCDEDIEICAGPFADEEEAGEFCPGLFAASCSAYPFFLPTHCQEMGDPTPLIATRFKFTVTELTDGTGVCVDENKEHFLVYGGNTSLGGGSCIWAERYSYDPSTVSWLLFVDSFTSELVLMKTRGIAQWRAPLTDWKCRRSKTLTLTFGGIACGAYPTTITIEPV